MASVLYISFDGMCDPLGSSQVLPYVEGLAAKGHRMHILSLEKKERLKSSGDQLASRLREKDISWSHLIHSSTVPILSQSGNVSKMKKLADRICKNERPSIVHCRSYPASLIGLYLKKKYGVKFIFDMRGFWPDERVEGKIWNIRNPFYASLYRYFKKKETAFLQNADHTICLTHAGEKEIRSWKNISPSIPITVIPCCADLDLFSAKNLSVGTRASIRSKLGIEQKELVVAYLGSLGTWYLLPEMLDFFKNVQKKYPAAVFLFITGDDPSAIKNAAAGQGIEEKSLRIVYASRQMVPVYLSACDLSVFFILPSFSKKASSPTKMAELLGMGKPVIINSGVGDCDAIMNENKAGFLVKELNDTGYKKAIDAIPLLLEQDPAAYRETAARLFSLSKGVEGYNSIYKELSN